MISKRIFLHFIFPVPLAVVALKVLAVPNALLPGLLEAGFRMPEMAVRQAGGEGKQNSGREVSGTKKPESRLALGKAMLSQGRIISFPLHFTAAAGETVGMIRSQVIIPEGAWKFQKVELAPGSRLKVSAKLDKQDDKGKGEGQGRQAVLQLSFSAGSHAIRNGLIGYVQFLLTEPGTPGSKSPVVRILATSPPETEQILTAPTEKPLPPGPAVNPAVNCFFFSH